ncbi:HAD family hydrolase [Trinickia symbiotica]|uniref:HAD family hydrolase n=1 Tax=Trinickia symbiotica TaxID=863227 RepID=UPI0003A945C2|nr:HAD family hydrolase [Trinickia symbiotica]
MDASVRALHEAGDESVFLVTLFATGETFEANYTLAMAEWLLSAGLRPGHVSTPKEIMPFTGDRIALNRRLRQLWRAIGGEMTRYFLATKVTSCDGNKLISLAIVGEDGREFYGEAIDFEPPFCSDFVNDVALPQLGRYPGLAISPMHLRNDVLRWMCNVSERWHPVLCYYFGEDRRLLEHLLGGIFPKYWKMEDVWEKLDAHEHEAYFVDTGESAHHALHNARANLNAFKPLRHRPKALPWVVPSLADVRLGDDVQAVIFDAFGTLCRIVNPRRPFLRLFKLGEKRDFWPARETVMTRPLGLRAGAAALGLDPRPEVMEALEFDLATELASIELYPEVPDVLAGLHERNLKVAVASNLAKPYAAPLLALLPVGLDVFAWSFEVGYLKPDRRIFHWTCDQLGVPPENALMIGDSLRADYQGARAAGMRAIHLRRQKEQGKER